MEDIVMAKLKFPNDTFVVVTTGEKAKTFRIEGGSLTHKADWTPTDLADDGPGGSTPVDFSPRELNEATFSKQIAERLYVMAQKRDFGGLVLIADPQTLGQIRPLLHREVTDKIVAEFPKTFINAPIADIEHLLIQS